MMDVEAIADHMRKKHVRCLSIRLKNGRFVVNQRVSENVWERNRGRPHQTLEQALTSEGVEAQEAAQDSHDDTDFEDLLG